MIEPKPTGGMPAWVSVVALVVCLGGGGAFAWWVAQDGVSDRIVVLDRAPGDGVKKVGREQWRVSAGYAVVQVNGQSGGAAPKFEFYFDKYDFLSPEHVETLATAKRLVNDRMFAGAVGITPAQMTELQDVRKQAKVQMSPDDERRLAAAWPRYAAATTVDQKRSPEDELIRITEQISERLIGPVKQSAVERSGRVKSVLTADQWQTLDEMGK